MNMKKISKKIESNDLVKIRKFLNKLGFVCNSDPSAQNLIYSKNGDIIIIKR
jgi:predicted lactoylglutathione lyase